MDVRYLDNEGVEAGKGGVTVAWFWLGKRVL